MLQLSYTVTVLFLRRTDELCCIIWWLSETVTVSTDSADCVTVVILDNGILGWDGCLIRLPISPVIPSDSTILVDTLCVSLYTLLICIEPRTIFAVNVEKGCFNHIDLLDSIALLWKASWCLLLLAVYLTIPVTLQRHGWWQIQTEASGNKWAIAPSIVN